MSEMTLAQQLRLLVGERIPAGGSASDTFFSDEEIQMLIDTSEYGLKGAAVLGWAAKAGEYSRLIDNNESGADRKLSQRFRQAVTQLQYYQAQVDKDVAVATTAGRVTGRSIDWANKLQSPGVLYCVQRYNRMPYGLS